MSGKFETPTDELMRDAENLTMNMGLREGPRNAEDQIGMAQVYAMLAIANELKRANDRADALTPDALFPSIP